MDLNEVSLNAMMGMEEVETQPSESTKALVKEILGKIDAGRAYHKDAFTRMKENQRLAREGAKKNWGKTKYKVNIIQRHIKQKTASLYAKNPRAVAEIKPRMYYKIWDGDVASLEAALMVIQQAAQMGVQTGMLGMLKAAITGQQAMLAQLQQAQMLVADFQQAEQKKKQLVKIGKTLEILFEYYMGQQMPAFKVQMKQLVRRAITCTVGYVKLGFQREMGKSPEVMQKISDYTARIAHINHMMDNYNEGEFGEGDAEMAELEAALTALQDQNDIVIREGLTFDFPKSTSLIVDPECTQLRGWIGAGWIAEEFLGTREKCEEIYNIDLSDKPFKEFTPEGKIKTPQNSTDKGKCMVRWYEFYDKLNGILYVVLEGYDDFLQPPAPPECYFEQFFPYFALTFNDLEDEESVYAPSDVEQIEHIQYALNSTRQALNEHRNSSRPKWAAAKGMLEDEEKDKLKTNQTNVVIEVNALSQGLKISDILQPVPSAPVDPNMYDTGFMLNDMTMAVGAPESTFGLTSGDTATEVADAAGNRTAATASNVDDFDEFFTELANAGGQLLLLNSSPEKVTEIVGPGAMWPTLSRQEVAREIVLGIEAGSSGKPNRAQDTANMERMIPLLIQVPGISPKWLAKQVVKRMDENVDLDEAIAEDMPSMISLNAMAKQAATGPAGGKPVAGEAQPANSSNGSTGGADNQEQPQGSRGGAQPANGDNTGAVAQVAG